MQISDAIKQLQQMLERHGDTTIYFDCPKCFGSFTPNRVVGVAIHLTEKETQ